MRMLQGLLIFMDIFLHNSIKIAAKEENVSLYRIYTGWVKEELH